MVLTAPRAALEPALVVPDEQTLTLSGTDPVSHGLRPVFAVGQARVLFAPERVPAALADAMSALLAELAPDARRHTLALPHLDGETASIEAHEEHGGHGGHGDDGGDHPKPDAHDGGHHDMGGGHHDMGGGHHDMMAIVGEPSRDGLVMEPIELEFGPLGTPLPGGLAVSVTLDGDVVAESSVEALLGPVGPTHPPDLLAPIAWTVAVESVSKPATAASRWCRLAAVECERAVSHLAWLRAFARILGWQLLVDRCTHALDGLSPLGQELLRGEERLAERGYFRAAATMERACRRAEGLLTLVRRSRLLRLRTAGIAPVEARDAERAGLRGPVARASGHRDDARTAQPPYERLGFEPVSLSGGDAHARTLVRAEEAISSLRLACGALREASRGPSAGGELGEPGATVEGPRGPLHVEEGTEGRRLDAPGSRAALAAAGEAMVGCEWATSLVALASFDLSPWRVEA